MKSSVRTAGKHSRSTRPGTRTSLSRFATASLSSSCTIGLSWPSRTSGLPSNLLKPRSPAKCRRLQYLSPLGWGHINLAGDCLTVRFFLFLDRPLIQSMNSRASSDASESGTGQDDCKKLFIHTANGGDHICRQTSPYLSVFTFT